MQAIRTRYIGPSNVRGSRIQAKCEARTIYVSYDHALSGDGNHRYAAQMLIEQMRWAPADGNYSPMIGGTFENDMYWVFADDISTGGAA